MKQTALQATAIRLPHTILRREVGGAENTATQVTALIMAGASVVAYIIGEGLTDSANIGSDDSEK